MEQDFINEELQKRLNADEEVQKIKEELKENLEDIAKFKKEQERINNKISIRRNNVSLLESKLRIKELEIKVTLLENTNNN
jgi:hypothetical protein